MALHGLDKDSAPDAATAKSMLDQVSGTWWNVYMGGPESGGSGWTPTRVKQYQDHGITHFILSYVGRQSGEVGRLTVSQGKQDGSEACELAEQFGYSAAGTPICLDLEGRTFDAAPRASLDYAAAWCEAVRAQRFRPGVYSNPRALVPLHDHAGRPDWIWAASWVRHTVDPAAGPRDAPQVSGTLWPSQGQRVWQYAGAFGGKSCTVSGIDVDIDVADAGCLAHHGGTVPVGGGGDGGGGHPGAPTYTVRAGDTLSSIAREFHVAGGWQAIYALNRDVIGPDPDVVRVGQVLRLP